MILEGLNLKLGFDAAKLEAGLKQASTKLGQFAKKAEQVGKNLSIGLTAPIVAFGVAAVRTAGNFEAAMNSVQAISGATGKEFDALTAKARELGKTTVFSATDAALAIETLAKNGLTAAQILGGAADAALLLASATGSDLSGAADIATDAMQSFGIKATEMVDVVNKITGVTVASKFDINDFRLALASAGGVAGKVGVEFDDFATALANTASSFSSGQDAGTSFKTFLISLNPKSKEGAELMDKLGLKFFDAAGKMKSMREITGQLQKAFAGLSEQQKLASAETIFGTDAMRTALALASNGVEGFDRLADSIDKVNAGDIASKKLAGFNGQLKLLSSAFQDLQITIANAGLLKFFTDMAKALTTLISQFAALDKGIIKTGIAVAGLAAAIGPALVVFGKMVGITRAMAASFSIIFIKIIAITAILGGLIIAIKAFDDAWETVRILFLNTIDKIQIAFLEWKQSFLTEFREFIISINAMLPDFVPQIPVPDDAFLELQEQIERLQEYIKLRGDKTFADLGNEMVDNMGKSFAEVKALYDSFIAGMGGGGAAAPAAPAATGGGGAGAGIAVPDIAGMGSTGMATLKKDVEEVMPVLDQFNEKMYLLDQAIAPIMQRMAESVGTAFGEMAAGAKTLDDGLKSILRSVITSLIDAAVAAIAAGEAINKSFTGFAAIGFAAAAGAAAKAFFSSLIPFAKGGMVKGATPALVGEYAGASTNPEVIAPLNQLDAKIQKAVNNAGGAGGGATSIDLGTPTIRLSGADIVASFESWKIQERKEFGFNTVYNS